MTTLLYTHPSCVEHETGAHHPERPARLNAIYEGAWRRGFQDLERREPPRASDRQLGLVHPASYVEFIMESIPRDGITMLDADTSVSPGSKEASLRAAGAVCAAVDAVVGGEADNAFCAVRPPGHHAEPTRPMGFCIFNNVAIGAVHARDAHGLGRAAVVDFDVHHGNGTQAALLRRSGPVLCLDPPGAALSRNRRRARARRRRQHRQPPAARGRGRAPSSAPR